MSVAQTILEQLGGNKFVVMVGAKNLGATENSLSFKFGKNASKSNMLYIKLNGNDLYDLTFGHVRKYEWVIDKEIKDVYAEQLVGIFEDYTKLKTRLF